VTDRLQFILDAAASQERVIFLVDGRVWEGHIESCLDGVLTAVARMVASAHPFTIQRWDLTEIADMAAQEPQGDDAGDDDELLTQARELMDQARSYEELSLAERLVRDRIPREE
jgi:hypothetical protein